MNTPAALTASTSWGGRTVREREPLSNHTTFRVGGCADVFHTPQTMEGLIGAVELCRSLRLRHCVVGGGSNVLFSDRGFRGVVISTTAIRGIYEHPHGFDVRAGERLDRLVERAEEAGVRSLSFLAGIPGTVGGAIAMNAGIRERSIGNMVRSVLVLTPSGSVRELPAQACEFGYRRSSIRADGMVVLAAVLGVEGPSFDRRALLERRAASQPTSLPSAGCVFRNPPGGSAGELIDRAGLKGFAIGKAQVSPKHANFIVNLGGATSAEICKLIDIVRQKVYNTFHVGLELEIEVVDG